MKALRLIALLFLLGDCLAQNQNNLNGGGNSTAGGANNDTQCKVSGSLNACATGVATTDSSGNAAFLSLILGTGSGAAGFIDLINGTAHVPTANSFSLFANSAITTGFGWSSPAAENSSAGIPHLGAASSHVSPMTVSAVVAADTDNSIAHTGVDVNTSYQVTATHIAGVTTNVMQKASSGNMVNSSVTDDGTTVTSTDTGGMKAPAFTATGTTAGFIDFPQGSSSAAVGPCNTANSGCFQAPAAVTAYVANIPAAGPTNNNSAWLFSNASPSVGTFVKMQQTAITTGTAYTNATTTFSDVKGSTGQTLSFSVEASTNYVVSCYILWQGSAGTTGPKFQFTGPASPTNVALSMDSAVTATTSIYASATAFSSAVANSGTITTATNFPAHIQLGLVNGVNAGTITLQSAANGTGTLTIQDGSYCTAQ